MNQSQFIKLLLLAVGFIAGISIANIDFFSSSKSSNPAIDINPDSIKKEVAIKEKNYLEDINALNVKEGALAQEKQSTNVALRQKKIRHNHLIQKINAEMEKSESTTEEAFFDTFP
jgi:hypothetical protein